MLPIRLCVSAILAGKKPAPLPTIVDPSAVVPMTPPPPKKETVPSPRAGVVWSSGYWKHTNTWFVWCEGHWELSRPGQRYVAPHWDQRADGWHFIGAGWHADGAADHTIMERQAQPFDRLSAFR